MGEGVGVAVGVDVGVGLAVGVGVGLEVAFGEVVGWGDCEAVGAGVGEVCMGEKSDGVGVTVGELDIVGCLIRAIVKTPTAVIMISKTAIVATLELDRRGLTSSSMTVI